MSETAESVATETESTPVTETAPAVEQVAEPLGQSDWRASQPEDLRSNPTIADTPSVEALAKRLIDTKSMVGNSIRIPSEDASPEDKQKFIENLVSKNIGLMPTPNFEDEANLKEVYKALGLPEEHSQYTKPENWAGVDDERFGFLAAQAHEAGLSKRQFESLVSKIAQADNEAMQKYEFERTAQMNELKGEWGNAFEQKTVRARNLAKQLEMPEDVQTALENGDVPASVYRWLDKMATRFGQEGSGALKEMSSVSEHTPTELNERFAEITKRLLEMDVTDPQYQALNQKRLKYMEMLHPG